MAEQVLRSDRIIIIGAGMAGLSAASHLCQNAFTNVHILEAQHRIGGRIQTVQFEDGPIELGANWIHGGSVTNPLFTLGNATPPSKNPFYKDKRILRPLVGNGSTIERNTRLKGFFVTLDGQALDENVAEKCFSIFFDLEKQLTNIYALKTRTTTLNTKENIQEYFERTLPLQMSTHFKDENERKMAQAIMRSLLNYLRFHVGDDLDKASGYYYGTFEHIPGGDVKIPGGYISLFNPLLSHCKTAQIHLNEKVLGIDYTDKDRIKVQTNSNVYEARWIINTMPLGFLKNHHQSIFKPPLPIHKVDAISKTGFGRVGKIFLYFNEPFWAKNEEGIKIVWSQETPENNHWTRCIFSFDEVFTNDNVLVCWISGDGVEIMENMTETEVNHDLTCLLRRLTGDESLNGPIKLIKTSWVTNELFFGTYTYASTHNIFPHDVKILSEPVGHIRFAGEHTHEKYYSTVHGARFSGIREASWLIEHSN